MENMAKILDNILNNIIKNDLQMIIAVAIIVVVLFLMWLIMRGPRLWYWKIKDKDDILKGIEERLDHIEGKVESSKSGAINVIHLEEIDDVQDKSIKLKEEDIDLKKNKFAENEKFVGKSGKIYTRKDLEAKIKK
jgi:hypothetical protein